MDKKLMIYPFNKRIGTVARYASLLEGYILTAVVSPKSYGYEGKDISYIDGGEYAGIKITSSFYESLNKCDSILFSSATFLIELNYYEERMQDAINLGKEVFITKELEREFLSNKKAIPFDVKVLGGNPIKKQFSYDEITHIREISVPVMTIFQAGEFCDGFATQLLMAGKFEEEGYKVSNVSSNSLGMLFGIHMFPDYIYEHHISYEDKVINFNYFLMSIIEDEEPDILLIHIEEAILPYNDRLTNHFGVIPTIISKAILSDVSILNLYYETYNKLYLDDLRTFCKYTLNAEIGYISMSSNTMTIQEFDVTDPIHYMSVDVETVLHTISTNYSDYNCMFFNQYDLKSTDSVYQDIVDKLSQNKDAVRIW